MSSSLLQHGGRRHEALDDVLATGAITSVFQAIVDLDGGDVVAVEALARGPEGPLHSPAALFEAARLHGRQTELEWACRAAAFRGALDAGLPREIALFVNVESGQLGARAPWDVADLERAAQARLRVVLELTERDLVRRPADVLRAVDVARQRGWGIALDDVGAHPDSLALMPLLRPDVVKLDLALVQGPQTTEVGRIASAVASYAEESGAIVLAEGIEDDVHLERALALGATLGQGWRWGRPAPIEPMALPRRAGLLEVQPVEPVLAASPFELVDAIQAPVRRGRKSQLLAISRHLERQATDQPTSPILLAAFEHARHFTAATARRYARYAETCPLVAAYGVGLEEEPAPGVRGADLAADDPLASEWTVVVLSPHFAAALVARDAGDDGPDEDRRFDFCLTHDRARVTEVARILTRRIVEPCR